MVERRRRIKVKEDQVKDVEEVAVPDEVVVEVREVVLTKFKKLGGGCLHFNNRIIKPGQIFSYDKTKLSKSFLDVLEVVSNGTEVAGVAETKADAPPPVRYEATEGKDGIWIVTNVKTGKKISTGKLSKEEVDALVKNLNG